MRKFTFSLIFPLLLLVACGRKADPQPADLVRPKPIATLAAEIRNEGIHLQWIRPEQYVNGKRIDDLGGFLVFRGVPGAQAEEIATIPVSDRERFRREKKYEYLDGKVEKGQTYYYRVVSFTTDHYYSAPSNEAILAPPQ